MPHSASLARLRSRVLAALTLLITGWLLVAPPLGASNGGARTVPLLQIDGAIGPATSDYLKRSLVDAVEQGAPFIVIRMDTPGGLDTSMREMIRAILASPVPVVTYVAPSGARAASAGTFILYASHVAAMAPGTNLGAATPVQIGTGAGAPGGGNESGNETAPEGGTAMERKAVNDAIAYIRSLAELRGRNADWAEEAVRTGDSLSASAAHRRQVIDIVARDRSELLRALDGRTVTAGGRQVTLDTARVAFVEVKPNWRTRFLSAITNPNVALILMLVGIYGLIFEFMNPGALYPGAIGAVCLLVGLYALAALPVNFAGLALMLLGIAMIAAEAFSPSFGVLGIAGTVALAIGATILIDTEVPQFRIDWPVAAGMAVATMAIAAIIARFALTSRRLRVVSGREELIGISGEVLDWKGGRGHVFVHGERWRARGVDKLKAGQAVEVRDINGLILTVSPTRAEPTDPPPE